MAEPAYAAEGGAAPDGHALHVQRRQEGAMRRPLHEALRPECALVHLPSHTTAQRPVHGPFHCRSAQLQSHSSWRACVHSAWETTG